MLEEVDDPANRPVHRRLDGAVQAADDQQQDERPLCLAGEEQDELPRIARQHIPLSIHEGLDDTLRPAPYALGEAVVLAIVGRGLTHSAAISFCSVSSGASSCNRKPPDCLCHNWAYRPPLAMS